MGPLGLVDGKIVDLNDNVVPIEDRGHQFGDGVYEVTRVYNGRPFALAEHLARLNRSAEYIGIKVPYTREELTAFHHRLIEQSGIAEGAVYLQLTRGVAPRIHHFPAGIKPRLTMTIRPVREIPAELRSNGAKGLLVLDERWLKCHVKSLNLLGNVLAKQAAQEAGCFEAIMFRGDRVTEGSSSNVFAVKGGELFTHPADNFILPGITRAFIIDMARDLGYRIREEAFSVAFLKAADEVFLTGTGTEVMPIVSLGGERVGDGKVGPVTRRLQEAYKGKIDAVCVR